MLRPTDGVGEQQGLGPGQCMWLPAAALQQLEGDVVGAALLAGGVGRGGGFFQGVWDPRALERVDAFQMTQLFVAADVGDEASELGVGLQSGQQPGGHDQGVVGQREEFGHRVAQHQHLVAVVVVRDRAGNGDHGAFHVFGGGLGEGVLLKLLRQGAGFAGPVRRPRGQQQQSGDDDGADDGGPGAAFEAAHDAVDGRQAPRGPGRCRRRRRRRG